MFNQTHDLNPLVRLLAMVQLTNLVLIAVKIQHMLTNRSEVDLGSWLSLGLCMLMFFGLCWVQIMAGSRIHAIVETAQRIIRTGDITQRIHDPQGGREVLSLITVLNQMLDEIEQLMHSVRTASDNIAHDLRHPLTRLRNHLEELREGAADCPQEQQKVADLVVECDQLLGTFQAILRISNIETGRRHGGFREVNLTQLVEDVIELYEPFAAQKNITILTDAFPTKSMGDKDLLFQALTNLVDNAIKYTPEGGTIDVSIMPMGEKSRIVISDTGRGVPDEHKPNIFRRFYRADPSRTMPGTGLGLSLVAAIITLHQGTITLSDTDPHGLTVTITL